MVFGPPGCIYSYIYIYLIPAPELEVLLSGQAEQSSSIRIFRALRLARTLRGVRLFRLLRYFAVTWVRMVETRDGWDGMTSGTTSIEQIWTWYPKQPFINGCFNWMIPNLYVENGCFTKHPFINGCLGFQEYLVWVLHILEAWKRWRSLSDLSILQISLWIKQRNLSLLRRKDSWGVSRIPICHCVPYLSECVTENDGRLGKGREKVQSNVASGFGNSFSHHHGSGKLPETKGS